MFKPGTTRVHRSHPRALALASLSILLLACAPTASAQEGSGLAPFGAGPSITSDKADYAPGERVTLHGSGWQPGESVSVVVEDDQRNIWSHTVVVTADAAGAFVDAFNLPDTFVATYNVTATGWSGVATTSFTDAAAELQGQSKPPCTSGGGCDSGWESGNLGGWAENDLIPMRVKLTGGFTNQPFKISFDRSLNSSGGTVFGIEKLTNFVGGSGVTITIPTTCDADGDVWAMCFNLTTSGTTNDANPKYVTFSALMAVGAHHFTGSSMAVSGDVPGGMGNVQVTKPKAGELPPGIPDLSVVKTCTAGCSATTGPNTAVPGTIITYRLDYANLATTTANTANTVVLRDVLSDNETFVGCSNTCAESGGSPNVLSWGFTSLGLGASGFVTVQAQLTSTAGRAVTNEGNIFSPQDDSNEANNVSTLTTTTQNPPVVSHPTSTTVSCAPNPGTYGSASTCTATVSDTAVSGKTAPTGTVTFDNGSAGGTFSSATCTLGSPTSTASSCSVTYTPTAVGTGTHAIGASYGANGIHNASSGSTDLVVQKATATVNITWATPQTYDTTTHPATAIVNGVGGETNLSPAATLEYFSGSTATGTPMAGAPTDVGTYTVRASFAGNGNYNSAFADKPISITKAAATVDITWATPQTYDTDPHPATATVDGVGGETDLTPAATFAYYSGGTATGTPLSGPPTDVSTYTVRASFAGNGNYNSAFADKTISITKAAATVVVTWATPQMYDTDPHPATATVNGVGGETDLTPAATLVYYSGSTASGTPLSGAPTDVGTYTVRATFAGNGNYNSAFADETISITKAAATVDIAWATPQTYDGDPHPATATVDGVGGDTNLSPAATLVYYSGTTATGSPLAGAPTNVGTYTVRASFAGNSNYNSAFADKTISITNAAATITITWATPQTYDNTPHPATAIVNGVGSATNLAPAATLVYYAGSTAAGTPLAAAPTNVGTYTVRASFAGNSNYNSAFADKTIEIEKAAATVDITWVTPQTYNNAPHPATATVDGVGGETNLAPAATLAYYAGTTATGTPLSGAPTNVGTYTVRASFAGNGNYNSAFADNTIEIEKAAATVDITWVTPQTYNNAPHPATATVDGVGGETGLTPLATLVYYAGGTATGTPLSGAPTNVGTYTVRASFAGNSNYNSAFADKTISITKAAATVVITWVTPQTYNNAPHPATATVDGVGGETGLTPLATLVYYAGGTATGTPLSGAPTNVGTYTVRASFAGNSNYNPAFADKTISITKADATVDITWATPQTYNNAPHPATATVDGVGGETGLTPLATLVYYAGGTATGTPLSGAPTNVGTYTVRASFAGNSNYNSAFADKTISITKAAATVDITWATPQTYDTDPHPATATVDGVGGETGLTPLATLVYYAGGTATGTPLSGAPTNAGTYTVRASFAGNGNYNSAYADRTIVIEKAAASVDITWATPQTYNNAPHPATAVVNGVGGQTNLTPAATLAYYTGVTVSGSALAGPPTNAGTYTVRASFAGNGNYDSAYADRTIVIEKAAASVDITWATPQTYNNAPHPATAVVNGVGGQTNLTPAATLAYYTGVTVSGSALAGPPTNAGTYTVRASFAGNGNYDSAYADRTIVIEKAAATVVVTWATPQTYDTAPHPATAVVNGVGGETGLTPAATLLYYSGSTATGTPLAGAPTDVGTYTVRASFAGNGNYNSAYADGTITIAKATPTVTLTVTPNSRQYSDKVDLSVSVAPTIGGTVQFQKSTNGGSSYSNIGSSVSVSIGAAALNNQQINDAPGTSVRFEAVFSPTDTANYASATDDKPVTVTQEDAGATYTGQMFLFTSSVSAGTVTVPLRATIQDATALSTSDSRYDGSAGDITKALVKFVARDTGAGFSAGTTICTATLTLIDPADSKTASASCPASFNIGSADSGSVEIGIVVGGYYLRDSGDDDTIFTVSKPIGSQFITGGGYLLLDSTSAGTLKGDANSKNNFGFNVKYNNKGTNLQGRVTTIIRKGGRVYQVKGNNLGPLGVTYCTATAGTIGTCKATPTAPCTVNASPTCPIQATFNTAASIQDVTNPVLPTSVVGGVTVTMDMVDWGEPGSNGPSGPDQMGISIWKSSTLWYSNRWNGSKTLMQLLNGGNLVVH